jgi:branched-subunit amino acid transport protein
MARQLTPLGIVVVSILKWVAIPLLAALIGYKLIGPNLGSAPAKSPEQKKASTSAKSPDGKKFQSVREGEN